MEVNKLTQILILKKYLEKAQKNGIFSFAEAANINNILYELISYINNVYLKQIKIMNTKQQIFMGHDGHSMINGKEYYITKYFDWIFMQDKIIKKKVLQP